MKRHTSKEERRCHCHVDIDLACDRVRTWGQCFIFGSLVPVLVRTTGNAQTYREHSTWLRHPAMVDILNFCVSLRACLDKRTSVLRRFQCTSAVPFFPIFPERCHCGPCALSVCRTFCGSGDDEFHGMSVHEPGLRLGWGSRLASKENPAKPNQTNTGD